MPEKKKKKSGTKRSSTSLVERRETPICPECRSDAPTTETAVSMMAGHGYRHFTCPECGTAFKVHDATAIAALVETPARRRAAKEDADRVAQALRDDVEARRLAALSGIGRTDDSNG